MTLKPLTAEQTELLRQASKRATRPRHQDGWVEEVGKYPKKWRGHYYLYVLDEKGKERRRHKCADLGPKSESTKTQAKERLRAIIADVMRPKTPAEVAKLPKRGMTVREFYLSVALPMWRAKWRETSRKEMEGNIDRYVIREFGDVLLTDLSKAALQMHVNRLAEKYSKSVVGKALTWIKKLTEEAVDNGFLERDPAAKLEMPQTRKVAKPVIQVEQLKAVAGLPRRERLILRILLVLGLRPSEMLALRANDVDGQHLRIDESNRYGQMGETKTEASAARVWMTPAIRGELVAWIKDNRLAVDDLLFRAPRGGPFRLDNYRTRFWNQAMRRVGLQGVTLQMCRRSCGTYMQAHGGPKDIQEHLRHAHVSTTMGVYVQPIAESVRGAVENLDEALFGEKKPKNKC